MRSKGKLIRYQEYLVDEFFRELNYRVEVIDGRAKPRGDILDKLFKLPHMVLSVAGSVIKVIPPLKLASPFVKVSCKVLDTLVSGLLNEHNSSRKKKQEGKPLYIFEPMDKHRLRVLMMKVSRKASYRYEHFITEGLVDDPLQLRKFAKVGAQRMLTYITLFKQVFSKELSLYSTENMFLEAILLAGLIEGYTGKMIKGKNTGVKVNKWFDEHGDYEHYTAEGAYGRIAFVEKGAGIYCRETPLPLKEKSDRIRQELNSRLISDKNVDSSVAQNSQKNKSPKKSEPGKTIFKDVFNYLDAINTYTLAENPDEEKEEELFESQVFEGKQKKITRKIARILRDDYGWTQMLKLRHGAFTKLPSLSNKYPKYGWIYVDETTRYLYGYDEKRLPGELLIKYSRVVEVVDESMFLDYMNDVSSRRKKNIEVCSFQSFVEFKVKRRGLIIVCKEHIDLSTQDLSYGVFCGIDFGDADLSRTILDETIFVSSYLEGANLSEVISAEGASFDEAHLEFVTAYKAKLGGATFNNAYLDYGIFNKATLPLHFERAASWIGASFEGEKDVIEEALQQLQTKMQVQAKLLALEQQTRANDKKLKQASKPYKTMLNKEMETVKGEIESIKTELLATITSNYKQTTKEIKQQENTIENQFEQISQQIEWLRQDRLLRIEAEEQLKLEIHDLREQQGKETEETALKFETLQREVEAIRVHTQPSQIDFASLLLDLNPYIAAQIESKITVVVEQGKKEFFCFKRQLSTFTNELKDIKLRLTSLEEKFDNQTEYIESMQRSCWPKSFKIYENVPQELNGLYSKFLERQRFMTIGDQNIHIDLKVKYGNFSEELEIDENVTNKFLGMVSQSDPDIEKTDQDFLSKSPVLLLQAPAGGGKTYYLKKKEKELWELFESGSNLVPVYIDLKTIQLGTRISNIIEYTLKHTCHYNDEQLEILRGKYHFIFFFDGLNEIISSLRSKQIYNHSQFKAWNEAKAIISCQNQFLLQEPNYWTRYFSIDKSLPNECYIMPFGVNEIKHYLQRKESDGTFRAGWNAEKYLTIIRSFHGLLELMGSPLLMCMVIDILPEIAENLSGTSKRITRNDIYEAFVNENLRHSAKNESNLMQTKEFMQNLAFLMFVQNRHTVKSLPSGTSRRMRAVQIKHAELLERFFWKKRFIKKPRISSTLLYQIGNNEYAFIHQSIEEYLTTSHIFDELCLNDQAQTAFEEMIKEMEAIGDAEEAILPNEIKNILRLPFNQRFLDKEFSIMSFLIDKLGQGKERSFRVDRLKKIISASTNRPALGKSASNAFTLLNKAGVSFTGESYPEVFIPQVNLEGGLLENVNFKGAHMCGGTLSQAWLKGTKFEGSNLAEVTFGESELLTFTGDVERIACSGNGRCVAASVASADEQTAIVIQVQQEKSWRRYWKEQTIFTINNEEVQHIDLDYKGHTLIVGTNNDNEGGKIYVWRLEQNNDDKILEYNQFDSAVVSVCINKDGSVCAAHDQSNLYVWNLSKNLGPFRRENWLPWDLSRDGNVVAYGVEDIYGDEAIKIYVQEIFTEPSIDSEPTILEHEHGEEIEDIALSGDRKTLISIVNTQTEDSIEKTLTLYVWNVEKKERKNVLIENEGIPIFSEETQVYLTLAADGKLLAVRYDNCVRLIDPVSGSEKWPIVAPQAIEDLDITKDGGILSYTVGDEKVHLCDIVTRGFRYDMPRHKRMIMGVKLGKKEGDYYLLSGGLDNTVRTCSVVTGTENSDPVKLGYGIVMRIALSRHGNIAAALCYNPNKDVFEIHIWNILSNKAKKHNLISEKNIRNIALSSDGKHLVYDCEDGIIIYNLENNEQIQISHITPSDFFIGSSIALSGDGKTLAFCDTDNNIRFWSMDEKEQCASIQSKSDIRGLALDKAAEVIVFCEKISKVQHTLSAYKRNTRGVYEPLNWSDTITLHYLQSVVISEDGKIFATANLLTGNNCNQFVEIWDVETGKRLKSLPQYTTNTFLSLDLWNNYLAVGAGKSIRLWKKIGEDWHLQWIVNRQYPLISDCSIDVEMGKFQQIKSACQKIEKVVYQEGKIDESIAEYEKLVKQYGPRFGLYLSHAYTSLGCLYHIKGEINKAETAFENAETYLPQAKNYCEHGHFQYKRKDLHGALNSVEIAIRKDDESLLIYSKSERDIVIPLLKQVIDQEGEIGISAKTFAHYLRIKCVIALKKQVMLFNSLKFLRESYIRSQNITDCLLLTDSYKTIIPHHQTIFMDNQGIEAHCNEYWHCIDFLYKHGYVEYAHARIKDALEKNSADFLFYDQARFSKKVRAHYLRIKSALKLGENTIPQDSFNFLMNCTHNVKIDHFLTKFCKEVLKRYDQNPEFFQDSYPISRDFLEIRTSTRERCKSLDSLDSFSDLSSLDSQSLDEEPENFHRAKPVDTSQVDDPNRFFTSANIQQGATCEKRSVRMHTHTTDQVEENSGAPQQEPGPPGLFGPNHPQLTRAAEETSSEDDAEYAESAGAKLKTISF